MTSTRSRDKNNLANPFGDHAASDDDEVERGPGAGGLDEDTDIDYSWSSTQTVLHVTRVDVVPRDPGLGAAIEPQRASTPRPSAFASGSSPAALPSAAAAEDPFRSPERPHNNPGSSLARGRAADADFVLSAPPRRAGLARGSSSAGGGSNPFVDCQSLASPRRPEQAHIEVRGRRHAGDTGFGRPIVDSPGSPGGRDESRSTLATIATTMSADTSQPYTTAPTSRQTSGGRSFADLNHTSPFGSPEAAAEATFSPTHGRTESMRGVLDGKAGPNDKKLKEKKSVKDMFGSLGRAFGRKSKYSGEGSSERKSSGLLAAFGGKRQRHAEYSTELKPFPTDSQLDLARRSPPAKFSLGGGSGGLNLPSDDTGFGIGSYRAMPSQPEPGEGERRGREMTSPGLVPSARFPAPVPAFGRPSAAAAGPSSAGSGGGGQRPDPYANKPLPRLPPRSPLQNHNEDEEPVTPKGKGKGKEVKKE